MSTERWTQIQIVCNACGERSEAVEATEMSERELRSDLKRRLGWVSYRTDVPRGHSDICPACSHGRKGGN
jgi:hypothetical protein